MAFDQPTRNRLARFVGDTRALLTEEFTRQLQNDYGLDPGTGEDANLAKLAHLDDARRETARLLRDTMAHYLASADTGTPGKVKKARQEALGRIVREEAFTVLNRLCALRMAEARGLLIEAVAKGFQSKGFQLYQRLAGTALGETGDCYRRFLFSVFDEFAVDLPVLFDRFSPKGRLFPREAVLLDVLAQINHPDIDPLWAEDETIGWIYQYWNAPEERKAMRKASAAPRNSRELAVRNQFFTPRYVVEFLTDNTLGRIWYEMRSSRTVLKERCRYMVRRPAEIFLRPGETVAEMAEKDDLSQEELLRRPVHIPHRPLKDPRDIRLLDPACGSMHFGLYAFDVFSVIYDEAWEMAKDPDDAVAAADTFAPFVAFVASFADKAAFLREVPRLIMAHNLHGIDIDPRAVQMAGLSLWLRAHRAWYENGVTPEGRPRITRSNIVCAEPMPGEKDLLREFVERQFTADERPAFAFLLEKIFDCMDLAGEAGSLLRIEEEIRAYIGEAQDLARKQAVPKQGRLFQDDEPPEQMTFDFRRVNDAEFWRTAEERIYDALEAYAERAENGGGFQRRLFAGDAAQGFAFIDLLRKRYDVAVMNPPFGDASLPSKQYIDEAYGDTKGDVYKAFVECFHDRLIPAGYLGIISSRTGFFLGQSEDWRTRVVLRLFRPMVLADLGMGVLDAMVEVAAYVLRNLTEQEARDLTRSLVPVLEKVVCDKQGRFSIPKWQAARGGLKRHQAVAELEQLEANGFIKRTPGKILRYTSLLYAPNNINVPPPIFPPLVCIRALGEEQKEQTLFKCAYEVANPSQFVCNPSSFYRIPGITFAYWVSPQALKAFSSLSPLESSSRHALGGIKTLNDARFLRTWWELPCIEDIHSKWPPMVKGGSKYRFYGPVPLAVDWRNKGLDISWYGYLRRPREGFGAANRGVEAYFRPGITWSRRTGGLSFRILSRGCIFSDKGPAVVVFDDDVKMLLRLSCVANSSAFAGFVGLQLARVELAQSFEVGLIQTTPTPKLEDKSAEKLEVLATKIWNLKRATDCEATSHSFLLPPGLSVGGSLLTERSITWSSFVLSNEKTCVSIQSEIDHITFNLYGLDAEDFAALAAPLTTEKAENTEAITDEDEDEEVAGDAPALTADLLAYTLGCAFGRWDIRYATGERQPPEPPDPFDPLPICPPGMLQGEDGLPLSPEAGRKLRDDGHYPLDIAWGGILVDDPEHPLDIERRIRAAFNVIWRDWADAIEQEACTLLGAPTLRDWFRRPAGFFADHLKRYSKSRRQAPIYWPLSTPSGSYTLWLYYHRLTDQTLYTCVNDFVDPKLKRTADAAAGLRGETGRTSDEEKELERLSDLELELKDFRDELLRIAKFWKPNLNDGVQITAAPLWDLFQLRPWKNRLKGTWEKLKDGEYDWAHLALSIWPERVVRASHKDRSYAIAHGLEERLWHEVEIQKKMRGGKMKKGVEWRPKDLSDAELNAIIAEVTQR